MLDNISVDSVSDVFSLAEFRASTSPDADALLANLQTVRKAFDDEVLGPKHKELVLLYLTWCTRRGARDMGIINLERAANYEAGDPGITAWLESEGMGDITNWRFAGMVDYLSTANGVSCSYGGHALRYAYYAVADTPEGQKMLRFGQNCASNFFGIDINILSKLPEVLEAAKQDLALSFLYGLNTYASATHAGYCMYASIAHTPEIAELVLQHVGQTALELGANFINHGYIIPENLFNLIRAGYVEAVQESLRAKGLTSSLDIAKELLINTHHKENGYLRSNAGVVEPESGFIYPLTFCSMFDALRACVCEQLLKPSNISVYARIWDMLDTVTAIEDAVVSIQMEYSYLSWNYPRTKVFYEYLMHDSSFPIKDAYSCFLFSCLTNDSKYLSYFLGLEPGGTLIAKSSYSGNVIDNFTSRDTFRY